MSSLTLTTRRESDRAILTVAGDLDLATVPQLREAALAALGSADCRTLVLDLDGLTFLDSTGLGCCIELRNRAEEMDLRFELVRVPPSAARTIAISGLSALFELDA